MFQGAERAMRVGDYATAAAYYDKFGATACLDEQSANAAAFAHLQLGNDNRALDYLLASLEIRSDQGDVNDAIAAIYLRRLDQHNSLKYLRRAVALAPESAEMHFKLGEVLISFDRFDEAIEALRAAVRIKPQYIQARLSLTRALMGLGKLDDAEAELQKAEALSPGNNAVAFRRGKLREKQQRLNEAIAIFRKVEVNSGHAAPVCESLALAELACGETEAAMATFRRGLEYNPQDRNLLRHCSELRHELADPQAFSYYENALKAKSEPGVRSDYIAYLIQLKKYDEAMDQLRRYESITGPDLVSATLMAELLYKQEKFEAALKVITHIPASDHDSMTWKAKCLISCGHTVAAQELLLELLKKTPYDQYLLAILTTCYRLNESPAYSELVDYDKLLIQTELDVPSGFSSLASFNDALRETLEELHVMRSHPISQSLTGGTQTPGNLLDQPHPVIQALKQAFHSTLSREFCPSFYQRIAATHPVSIGKDCPLSLPAAWSIWLRQGGYHRSHVHTRGWYSSAYYVSLPSELKAQERTGNNGELAFGKPDLATAVPLGAEQMITPAEGILALFPSYFWHGTLPFKSTEPRVVVAFDALPVRSH